MSGCSCICNKIGDCEINFVTMPETIGIAEARIARATRSSLNAHRSSIEPPPACHDEDVALRTGGRGFDGFDDGR